MERITLTIKDSNKLPFFKELIGQFDFIELEKSEIKPTNKLTKFAGIWPKNEATKMKADINKACERINEEDW